jgi:hypothetical protein
MFQRVLESIWQFNLTWTHSCVPQKILSHLCREQCWEDGRVPTDIPCIITSTIRWGKTHYPPGIYCIPHIIIIDSFAVW